jgi:beta-mannanase
MKITSKKTTIGLTVACTVLIVTLAATTNNYSTLLSNEDSTIASLNKLTADLNQKIKDLEAQNATLHSEITDLSSQITDLNQLIQICQTENATQRSEIRDLQTRLTNAQAEISLSNNRIADLTAQISDTQKTLTANQNRITQLENKVNEYEAERIQIGIYPSDGESIWKYEEQLDVRLDYILQYQKVTNLNHTDIKPFLDRGYDVILAIEFTDSYANLHDIAQGKYDTYLNEFAETLKNDGRMIWLRPLHEFNADWYNWGTFYNGNNITDFKPAWQHIVQVFRNHNAPVKFQLNYNRISTNASTTFSAFWPGDEWVDLVSITSFNRAYTDQSHQYWHSFAEDFDNAYQQVTALTQKPIGVAETSSTSYNGSKPQWIVDAFNSIAYNYTRIQQVSWFLENKVINSVMHDWDLNTPEEKQAFTQGMDVIRRIIRI